MLNSCIQKSAFFPDLPKTITWEIIGKFGFTNKHLREFATSVARGQLWPRMTGFLVAVEETGHKSRFMSLLLLFYFFSLIETFRMFCLLAGSLSCLMSIFHFTREEFHFKASIYLLALPFTSGLSSNLLTVRYVKNDSLLHSPSHKKSSKMSKYN